MQNNRFYSNKTLNVGGRLLGLDAPAVMGILNVTPDSFYDGGRLPDEKALLQQAEKMLAEGASILDIGGYSTRPRAEEVPVVEETRRVQWALQHVAKSFPNAILSVDTFRASVARMALDHGAHMVNDVTAGEADPDMVPLLAARPVPYIIMHMRGTPQTMVNLTQYDDLTGDIRTYLQHRAHLLVQAGIPDVLIDPGFGFAKTVPQNFELLHTLEQFTGLPYPVVVGLSRKSMIWRTLESTPEEALNGTTVLHTIALLKGASILRVHDVKAARECIQLVRATAVQQIR